MSKPKEFPPKAASTAAEAEDLIRSCLRGEDSAWRLFLERYGDLVFSVPLKMGLPHSDAEEVFQITVLALVERLGTLNDPRRIVAWICEVARRQTLYYLRKRSRESLGEDEAFDAAADASPGAHEAFESLEASQVVRDALAKISPRCRDLLTALYLADPAPAYKEIAESLEIPMGSIGPTRARCLKSLQTLLASTGYGDA
ncbi:MAG: RNA polymerase sigma factor [bacterium]